LNNSNQVDRVSRLGVTLTILGVAWYLLKRFFELLFDLFSRKLFLKSLYSTDHILALTFVTMFVTTFIWGVKYVYAELKTFKEFKDEVEFHKANANANKNFNDIFILFKVNISLLFIVLFVIVNAEIILNHFNIFWLILYILILVVIGVLFCIKKTRDKFMNSFKKLVDLLMTRIKHLGFWLYTFFIIFVLAFSFTVISFSKGQVVNIDFEDKPGLPVDIELVNVDVRDVKINIYNEDNEKINGITLKGKDFFASSFEVLESRKTFWDLKSNDTNYNSTTTNLDKNYYVLKKNLKIEEEFNSPLNNGKYRVEIIINSKNLNNTKTMIFVNDIVKSKKNFLINKEKFKIKL
jgi:hypothetical protein